MVVNRPCESWEQLASDRIAELAGGWGEGVGLGLQIPSRIA